MWQTTESLDIDFWAEEVYFYARYVIGGRWPAGEWVISLSPEWAYRYACNVMKARWPAGEKAIRRSPKWWMFYLVENEKENFIFGRSLV